MTDDQIKHMTERFLGWKLPDNFTPDAGISFKAEFNEHTQWPMRHQPTGTNLFDYTQAEAMVRYMAEGMEAEAQAEMAGGDAPGWADQRLARAYGLIAKIADEHSSEGDIWPALRAALEAVESADCKVGSGE